MSGSDDHHHAFKERSHDAAAHDHERSHHHDLKTTSRTLLWWALLINLVFLGVEVAGGLITGSLALLADAGHMATDVAALALALTVSHLAARPATPERTYGMLRAEVLGAFVNGATLVVVVGLILREAWSRLGAPPEVNGPVMLLVAALGLVANLASAWLLMGGRKDNVNVEGAFLHMAADALGSVGAIVAGIVIWTTGWALIDPVVSVVIGILILWSSAGLLKNTINILLEATPGHIDYNSVKQALEELEHVDQVHDLHIWTISTGKTALSAHLALSDCCCDAAHWPECLAAAEKLIKERFQISHTTLQVEPSAGNSCDQECKLV